MQSVKPAVAATGAANPAQAAKSPTDIARETLRMLAMRKLAPTPDNYQRLFEEISGTHSQHADDSIEPLLLALRDLPRASPALKESVARMQRAVVGRNWKAFSAEIQSLGDTSAAAQAPAAAESGGGSSWPDTIRELLKQYNLRHTGVSPQQKQEGLERVLGGYGHSPLLKDRLLALVQSWGATRGGGAPLIGDVPLPVAASALGRLDLTPGASGSSSQMLRRLLAEVLRNEVAPRFANEPVLAGSLMEMAELAGRADSPEACALLSERLNEFWSKAGHHGTQDGALVEDLMGLVRLLVENIGELVDDDQWIGGQVEVMRRIMAQPLTPQLMSDAQSRFREIIIRQGTLKNSLADAKSTLRDMISVFIERLGDMSRTTTDYHEKIGVYADEIERSDDLDGLRDVLDNLMGDIRLMQTEAMRSRDEVVAAREQAQAAESKIRQLERELEEVSEKVREDALTGSLNRRGLDEALAREAARAERYGNALCVSVIDLDNFKKLNDTHGHQAGDKALVHLVQVVKSLLRPGDSIGRFGGEEFVILLPETTLEAGKLAIERLQRELTKQFFLSNNEKLLITFSAGVAQFHAGETESDVVKRADHAMYVAKQAGKNRVCIAD